MCSYSMQVNHAHAHIILSVYSFLPPWPPGPPLPPLEYLVAFYMHKDAKSTMNSNQDTL